MALEREYEVFQRELPNLLREHEGEYVLIHGDKIEGLWKTEDEAYDAAIDRFGDVPFFIEKVDKGPPAFDMVSRPILRCPP